MRVVRVEWYCEYKASELFLGSTISSDEKILSHGFHIDFMEFSESDGVSRDSSLGGDIDLECYGEVIGEGLGGMDV